MIKDAKYIDVVNSGFKKKDDIILESDLQELNEKIKRLIGIYKKKMQFNTAWNNNRLKFIVDTLEKLEYFSLIKEQMGKEGLKKIAFSSTIKEYQAEEVVFYKGDSAKTFFIILVGKVGVYVHEHNEKTMKQSKSSPISILKMGAAFGDLALIKRTDRTATVKTLTDCSLLEITYSAYQEVLKEIQTKNIHNVCEKLREFSIFSKCPLTFLQLIYYSVQIIEVKKGDWIYRENDEVDGIYLIYEGSFEITKSECQLSKNQMRASELNSVKNDNQLFHDMMLSGNAVSTDEVEELNLKNAKQVLKQVKIFSYKGETDFKVAF